MGKHKDSLQTHHLYLGAGGMLAVAALVVALTFGLSSAASHCVSPEWWDAVTATCKTPTVDPAVACATAGGTYNAANSPPCTMPITDQWATQRNECTARGTSYSWNDAAHTCNQTQTCSTGQWWDMAMNSGAGGCRATVTAVQCDWATQYTRMSDNTCQPRVNCTTVGNVDYNTAECQGVRSAAGTPPEGGCQAPTSFWNGTACVAPLVTGVTCTTNQHKMPGPPEWCMEGTTHTADGQQGTQWTQTRTECPTSKPISCEANNAYTCTVTQVECDGYRNVDKQPRCPTGEHWESSRNVCVGDQQACPSDQYRDSTGACVPMSEKPPYDRPPPPPDWQPGQCQPDQQQCPSRFNPSGTVCMPKELTWDPKTKTRLDTPRPATCADFQPPEGPDMPDERGYRPPSGRDRGPRFDFGERRGQGEGQDRPMSPCELNPDDPFCQFGFDFNKFGEENKFDESMFDFDRHEVRNVKQELKNLKREAKGWSRDAKQARQQLQEIGRESSGFACPAAAEVDALVAELENAASQVGALTEASSEEEIQRGLAVRDHVNGQYNHETDEQTPGIRSKLYGGPPDPETGEPVPGKIQGLNVCRELSGVIFGACQAYKNISREFENIKENAPAEAVAVFEGVLPELESRCNNPLGVLAEKGISLDVLIEPWYPDSDKCDFGGFGPGPFPGPFPGPMPMGGGPGGFPGGDFPPMMGGPFGDMPPEMMEMMMEKMKEMGGHRGSGDYPDPGFRYPDPGFRGRDFQSSVLMPPSHPFNIDDEDDFFDDDDFEGEEGFGPPEECQPPVMRYLGLDKIMRKLDQVRPLMAAHFESMNACKMFEMGKKMSDRESVRGGRFGGPPPEIRDLMALGLQACEAGDSELVDKIKKKMMRFGLRGGGLKGVVDFDALVKDKLKEKFEDLLGSEEDEEGEDSETIALLAKQVADLQSQLNLLTKQLSEAQLAILALKEQVATSSTKIVQSGLADKDTLVALTNFGSLSNNEKTSTTLSRIDEVVELTGDVKDALKEALPAAAEKKVLAACDAAVKSLVAAPPTDNIVTDIKDSLVALQSYTTSGANKKEITNKAIEECSSIAAANVMDVSAKVVGGICASGDTCNFREWYAAPALEAKELGFIAKELTEIKPGEPETRCAAVTRVARLMEKAGKVEIDLDDKSPERSVEGAPDWCLPFISALQEKDVPFAEGLKDPNTPIKRGEVAVLIHQALGDKLPDPPDAAEFLTPDTENLSEEEKAAIAKARFNGIFGTVDGKHFAPDQIFNRAQNALVTIKALEAVRAGSEK